MFAIFIFRLVWLVTVNHVGSTNLKQNATYNFQSTVSVQAKRGTIYDRYGTAIAVDSSSYTLYVVLDKKNKPMSTEINSMLTRVNLTRLQPS